MLSEILSKEECAKCRICCSFDSYDLWETPVITPLLASKILQEYAPDAKFVKKDDNFLLKMEKEADADLYFCSMLDQEKGCILGDDKPFDCRIWPYRVMAYKDTKVITLSPVCPAMNKKPISDLIAVAKKIAAEAFEYADKNPEAVKPYLKGYPILVVDDTKYNETLV